MKVLDFPSECCVIFLTQGPVNEVGVLRIFNKQEFVLGGNSSVVLSNWTSIKGTGVDHAATAVSGKKFGIGGMEVIGDEGGNYVFLAVRDDKEVASTSTIEVVLPPGARVNSWLRAVGTGSVSLCVSVPYFGFQRVSLSLLV